MKGDAETFDLASCGLDPGIVLVEASAGTGKTYSLTGIVLRLLLEKRVSGIGKILVMTFTNAATAELIERIRAAVRSAAAAFETEARAQTPTKDPFIASLVASHGEEGRAILRAALRDLDEIEVSTIHGFCRRVLDQNALEVGVPFEMDYVENDRGLLRLAAEDFWRCTVYPAGPVAARVIADEKLTPASFLKAYKLYRAHPQLRILPVATALEDAIAGLADAGEEGDTGVKAFVHALRTTFLRDIDALVEREKRIASKAGYDDLLHRLHARLADASTRASLRRAIGAQFEVVLVDEFQDTDAIQLAIFEGLFEGAMRFYVGDPKQAIYSFRGADVFAYLRAKLRAQHIYTMDKNWRSETPLVEAVSALFSRSTTPFVLDAIPFPHVTAQGGADTEPLSGDGRSAFEWIWLPVATNKTNARRLARDAVAREIVHLLDPSSGARIGERAVDPRDIAVLVRTNRDAAMIQEAIESVGVPAVVSQAGSVFDSDEAAELDLLLRAVLDPQQATHVRAALATRAWGFDAVALAALSEDDKHWQARVDELVELRALWFSRGFAAMAGRLLDICQAPAHLLSAEGGQRRLTNLFHLIELGQQAIGELALSPDGLADWLARTRADQEARDKDIAELRLESDADAVQIVTIHKSKGLEYEIVFVPFAWDTTSRTDEDEGALVHRDDEVILHFPELPEEIETARDDEQSSEEARVAYVALTRAKHRCYVAWGALGSLGACDAALARLIDPSLPPTLTARKGVAKEVGLEVLSERWRNQLEALCRTSSGSMAIRDYDPASSFPKWQAPAQDTGELGPLAFPESARPRLEPWRIASFSSFSNLSTLASERTPSARQIAERPDYVDPEVELELRETTPRGIFAFARGARAGSCLHEIFEKTDFAHANGANVEKTVAETLAKYGLSERTAHKGEIDPVRDVTDAVRTVLEVPLPGETFSLSTVTRAKKLSEWQFYLPMATVSAAGFADVFEKYDAELATAEYVASLRALAGRGVEGFLTGFVDLVFMHDDRWFIVDWKSNHLGNDARAYDDAAIARAMREHHYVLQYHLYVLALHRYLRQRVRDYDYDRHMGGVYYAFLRGIRGDPKSGSTTGWYRDRPSRALVEALDALVGGGT